MSELHKFVPNSVLPSEWIDDCYHGKSYALVSIPSSSTKYQELARRLEFNFNLGITKIERVQNPFLYGQFLIKKEEYESRGMPIAIELFHDTDEANVESIVSQNFDWRLANRYMYGRGVNFSSSPSYANAFSSPKNGKNKAMVIADVLIRSCQKGTSGQELPDYPCDTTTDKHRAVFVKYFDDEFYPKYLVYYRSQ